MSRRFFSKDIFVFFLLFLISGAGLFGKPYKSNVVVSYYADDFHGKKTSNGERFNMYALTCAHKSLPFDTILKITNRANGLSVQVRVNDRGPFVYAREVDLSKAAAVKLDMIKTGTARCDIEIVKMGPDTKISRQTAAKTAEIMRQRGQTGPSGKTGQTGKNGKTGAGGGGNAVKHGAPVKDGHYKDGTFWDIQVASFSSKENATKFAQGLLKKGFKNVVLQKTPVVYRVVIKNVAANSVKTVEAKLLENGYSDILIRQRLK